MRVVALTYGTEGDTRPMVALARGLVDAGHDVTLLAERSGEDHAAALRVPFVALAGDMAGELRRAASGLARSGVDARSVARTLAAIANANTSSWMRATIEHARDAEVVVCAGLAIYVGLSVAEALGIRAIGAGLQPLMPTRAFASPFLPPLRLPGFVNRASHRFVLGAMWRAFRGAINDARCDVAHQTPRKREWTDYPVLFGISPALVPRPRDWGERVAVTGYWFGPRDPHFAPDRELAAFLASGEPPVYVGFGSMLGFDRERVLATVLEALDGRRALLHSGWSDFANASLPANVLRIAHVPHDWLFPKMSTVVHHGGAGTTHAAARAGVPAVVLPFAADQFFWAKRLEALGVAPPMLAHRELNPVRLSERLEAARSDGMRERARQVAMAMSTENGVANAVERIDAWGERSGATLPVPAYRCGNSCSASRTQ
jgi:sterol 3beta-glucosyltransferase